MLLLLIINNVCHQVIILYWIVNNNNKYYIDGQGVYSVTVFKLTIVITLGIYLHKWVSKDR